MRKESPTAAFGAAKGATVSPTGQVTIPASVRNAAGIKGGSSVVFTPLPDGRVVMRTKSGTLADLRGVVKTTRNATDAQIRNLKPGTIVRRPKATRKPSSAKK